MTRYLLAKVSKAINVCVPGKKRTKFHERIKAHSILLISGGIKNRAGFLIFSLHDIRSELIPLNFSKLVYFMHVIV